MSVPKTKDILLQNLTIYPPDIILLFQTKACISSTDAICYGFSVATQAENRITVVEASSASLKTYSSTVFIKLK